MSNYESADLHQQRDPDCGEKIRALTNNALTMVFDTIALPDSAAICAAAISSSPLSPATYCNLLGEVIGREDVRSVFPLGLTVIGESFHYEDRFWPADANDFELGCRFADLLPELLEKGRLKPHPRRVVPGGLNAILQGMKDLEAGKVSGEKLVYLVEETTWPRTA